MTLTKEFTDDPVLPGGQVTLRFTIDNISASEATDIQFEDDLDEALTDLAVAGGLPDTQAAGCGTGSSLKFIPGQDLLRFGGGVLASEANCTFDVTLDVPAAAEGGDYLNTTRFFFATVGSTFFIGDPATDALAVRSDLLLMTKEFTDDPVEPGRTVTLRFILTNEHPSDPITDIGFTDDLADVIADLVASGLPDPVAAGCGAGATISGTSVLTFADGELAGGGVCILDVTLAVPVTATAGTYSNTTSDITGTFRSQGVTVDPATDDLLIIAFTPEFQPAALLGIHGSIEDNTGDTSTILLIDTALGTSTFLADTLLTRSTAADAVNGTSGPNGLAYDTLTGNAYFTSVPNSGGGSPILYSVAVDPPDGGPPLALGSPTGAKPHDAAFFDGKYWYIDAGTDDLHSISFDPFLDIVVADLLTGVGGGTLGFGDIAIKDGILYGAGLRLPSNRIVFFTVDLSMPATTYTEWQEDDPMDSPVLQLAFGGNGTLFGQTGALTGEQDLYYVSQVPATLGEPST